MQQTKLKEQAPRTALMEMLDYLSEKRVIYMHAPGGYGKTVSATLWLERKDKNPKRAIISLDEYDNKVSEFCKRFI